MATGTGKTIVSALDYRDLRREHQVDTLLFVAHREELLRQALTTFRTVLRQGDFGEQYVGGEQPESRRHVFASIQSLSNLDLRQVLPTHFSMVIVDEFHRAEAPTYERLLQSPRAEGSPWPHATPERTDGQDVTRWFGGRIAVELRVWEALDRGLLSPFQYFGVADDVDLAGMAWRRGRMTRRNSTDTRTQRGAGREGRRGDRPIRCHPAQMRALGFCVSVEHARFMADYFRRAQVKAVAIDGTTAVDLRRGALRDLADRKVDVIFAVDLLNEGIDVPSVDTILFLRPTESATLFLQQLGRGLRHADGKACLTVLDFIGNQHARFRFDRRFRSLTGGTRRRLVEQIQTGFPICRRAATSNSTGWRRARSCPTCGASCRALGRTWLLTLRTWGRRTRLQAFLEEAGFELDELYAGSRKGWLALRRKAGLTQARKPRPSARLSQPSSGCCTLMTRIA